MLIYPLVHISPSKKGYKDLTAPKPDESKKKLAWNKILLYSAIMLRRHKVLIHDSGKETNQSIILGFEADVQRHCKMLESKGKSLENFICEECDFKIYSSGKLTLHKVTTHQG